MFECNVLNPDIIYPFEIIDGELEGSRNEKHVKLGNIGDHIIKAFKRAPDFIGQIDVETDKITTFQEMREKSVKCAIFMMRKGIKKGDVVSICIYNHMNAYIPYLACLYIGAIADLWHENYLKNAIRTLNFLAQNKPKMIFTNSKFVDKFYVSIMTLQSMFATIIVTIDKQTSGYLYIENLVNQIKTEHVERFKCVNLNVMDVAAMMFSPTANIYCENIQFPHLMFTYPPNRQVPNMQRNDIGMWYTSFYSLHGPFLTVHAILARVKVLKPGKFNEENMFKIIHKYRVNWVFLESSVCNRFATNVNIASFNLTSLREFVCDAEIKHSAYLYFTSILRRTAVIKVYSTVETGVIAYARNTHKVGTSGYVAQATSIIFVDLTTRTQLPLKRCGEIWCKAPHVISRNGTQYYKRNMRSVSEPTIVDYYRVRSGWFFTGDWGYYDEDGAIFIVERANSLIKYYQGLVAPSAIERVLETHGHVKEAYAVPRRRPNGALYIGAYVKPARSEINLTDVFEYLKLFPNPVEYEEDLEILTFEVSRLPNGRVDRLRLPK